MCISQNSLSVQTQVKQAGGNFSMITMSLEQFFNHENVCFKRSLGEYGPVASLQSLHAGPQVLPSKHLSVS